MIIETQTQERATLADIELGPVVITGHEMGGGIWIVHAHVGHAGGPVIATAASPSAEGAVDALIARMRSLADVIARALMATAIGCEGEAMMPVEIEAAE